MRQRKYSNRMQSGDLLRGLLPLATQSDLTQAGYVM